MSSVARGGLGTLPHDLRHALALGALVPRQRRQCNALSHATRARARGEDLLASAHAIASDSTISGTVVKTAHSEYMHSATGRINASGDRVTSFA